MLKTEKRGLVHGAKTVLLLFFLAAAAVPLAAMLLNLTSADLKNIYSNPQFATALKNSIAAAVTATAISVCLAIAVSWAMERSHIRFKGLFNFLLLLPMLIPSISHGMGLIILFGSNGMITNWLGASQGIYGFWGIVLGSVMYSFPVAYLMLSDVLRYEDGTPYEAAAVLGISKVRQMAAITLPYLRKPLINVIFATFTMIVTDYGVPLMVGGRFKTLPVLMYEEVIGRLDFAKGSAYGVILLLPAVAAFLVDRFCQNRGGLDSRSKQVTVKKNTGRDVTSYVLVILVCLCVVLPIFAFGELVCATRYPKDMTFTLKHIQSAIDKGALTFLGNSVTVAALVAVLGTVISFLCAYMTVRLPSRSSSLLHMMSILSLAIPGIVLGLSYVLVFKGSFIYGSIAILVLVNIIHFFSSPYLMMYNSLGKLDGNLESVGLTLGAPRYRVLLDVILPQTRGTLLEMGSYFFVNSMMTISAVSFLANSKTKPISLMINQFEAQSLLEASAFVSLLILAVNLTMKGIIYLVKKKTAQRI